MLSIVYNPDTATETLSGDDVSLHGFDESWYVNLYPDVAAAIQNGEFEYGKGHYYANGRHEGRYKNRYHRNLSMDAPTPSMIHVDRCEISEGGTLCVMGWCDEEIGPDAIIHIFGGITSVICRGSFSSSYRREDVEIAFPHLSKDRQYGFMMLIPLDIPPRRLGAEVTIEIAVRDIVKTVKTPLKIRSDREMLSLALGFQTQRQMHGSYWSAHFDFLGGAIGDSLVGIFRRIVQQGLERETCIVLRESSDRPVYSHIIVLYRQADLLPIQLASFARALKPGEEVEFVIVVNGSDIANVTKQAISASLLKYDISIKLVTIPDNIGFGAANNVGVRYATAPIVIITNPDVFVKQQDLYEHVDRTTRAIQDYDIHGAWLYYADGSVMHSGMSIVEDVELSRKGEVLRIPRVIHDRKGFRPELLSKVWGEDRVRTVQAVTGAWMVMKRQSFLDVGGFDDKYIFGHYEDADLCMRASARGGKILVQRDVELWHLEGKGSESKSPTAVGASIVNRWTFTNFVSSHG